MLRIKECQEVQKKTVSSTYQDCQMWQSAGKSTKICPWQIDNNGDNHYSQKKIEKLQRLMIPYSFQFIRHSCNIVYTSRT